MKIGIFISGLGQSFESVPAENYANNLVHELNQEHTGINFKTKTERIKYVGERECAVVSVIQKTDETESTIYKFYDYAYSDLLTSEFNKKNILIKSLNLFGVVVSRFPSLLGRVFKAQGYHKPFQIFYLFGLFLVMGSAILFMIPACITVLSEVLSTESFSAFFQKNFAGLISFLKDFGITKKAIMLFSNNLVSITAIVMLLVPQAKAIVTTLATEFVCTHRYLARGEHRQEIFKDIDDMVEYIVENEEDPEIHFHSYSFGSIIAIDYLFPFGNMLSSNVLKNTKALITTGSPFDFIKAYYPKFYEKRNHDIEPGLCWLNVYSISDALASNFRRDANTGESQVGVRAKGLKPININYEIANISPFSLTAFFSLHAIKAHGCYWLPKAKGQSCLKLIYREMAQKKLL
jgi:hypothetical protein